MSEGKQIRKNGIHQEDLVEIIYYLVDAHASVLGYVSDIRYRISAVITALSGMPSVSISLSLFGAQQSISALTAPTSLTTTTGVSISLL